MNEHTRVDFLVVASARGGTSWLYLCLRDNPDICLSAKKEFNPFDAEGRLRAPELAEQFAHCKSEKALRGVMPVMLSARKESSELVKKNFPNAKIIMCLRNPIERAYSNYKHNVLRGKTEAPTFGQAIREGADFLKYGFYAHAVETYRRDMGEENVFIFLHDELMQDHAGMLTRVQEFLGVPVRSSEYVDYFVNVSRESRKTYRSDVLLYLHRGLKGLSAFGKRVGGNTFRFLSRSLHLGAILVAVDKMNRVEKYHSGKEEGMEQAFILPEDRAFLQEYYQEDIRQLSALLGKELSWS